MENKKIKNATQVEYNGIKFKSKQERDYYKVLLDAGFNVLYEPDTFVLWEGFKPTLPFYTKDKKTHMLKLDMNKIIDIKYTPDLYIRYKEFAIFIEVKGKENDVFYIKKKLFRAYLERVAGNRPNAVQPLYFEIFTKKQLLQAIDIIKSL